MKRFYLAGLCALAPLSAVYADTFDCTLIDKAQSGWLPDRLVFEVTNDTEAQAFDAITASTRGGIVPVDVKVHNDIRIDLVWKTGEFKNPKATATRDDPGAGPRRIVFHATLLRGSNKIQLKARPAGGRKKQTARGACSVLKRPIETVVGN